MKNIYCPHCKKMLLKAKIAYIEIKCKGCDRIVEIKHYSQKAITIE